MPVQYQPFNTTQDVTTTKTLLHEVIPITGSIISGTYADANIKDYSHGMFQSVYDYPYLSSSANHIFDLTVGYDEDSGLSGSASTQNSKKINLYNQHAQVLLGYTGSTSDADRGIRKFERDLDLDEVGQMNEVIFVNFSRLVTKDQIKKGSFSLTIGTGSFHSASFHGPSLTISDYLASDRSGFVGGNPGGDYGILYTSSAGINKNSGVGNVFYQSGIAVLTASIFNGLQMNEIGENMQTVLSGSTITENSNEIRHRIDNISFNNTTELNSKIYFCRVPHNRFNYSSNPTYVDGARIRVKDNEEDQPISYITTVGLYSSTGELLATAKLSEPLRKDPTNELTLRVRLDY